MALNKRWTQHEEEFIYNNYASMTVEEIALCLGRSSGSVRSYCYLRKLHKNRKWTSDEVKLVEEWYSSHPTGELSGLVQLLNRTKPEISILAKRLGISNNNRPKSKSHKDIIRTNIQTRYRNGFRPSGGYTKTRSGKREDLGGLYVRSAWEANYARYLNYLIYTKQIVKWEYESDVFEFTTIKKGTRFYIPDFKIFNLDGSIVYHEVKGWMDKKSKTKLNRMAKYYPEVKIKLIGKKEYKELAKVYSSIIDGWEIS